MHMIPIAKPYVGQEELDAIHNTFLTGSIAQGKAVEHFENQFAHYCDTKYGIATNNGTSALHATLAAMGIGPGDEVIVPSFSFIATATAVSMCGATPVFADIYRDIFVLDPASVERLITPKTKAIIGVHLFGHPFFYKPLAAICKEYNLRLIEDACQAHGAIVRGGMFEPRVKVGAIGDAACFSFYATKNMTTGEGGMITTSDDDLNQKIRRFINHGQSEKYVHPTLGYNYRMTDVAASMGIVQLQKLDAMNAIRIENAHYYDRNIHADGILTPVRYDGYKHVFHQYAVRVIEHDCTMTREELMKYLHEKEIGTAIHYPTPIHKQPLYYKKSCGDICPMSTLISKEILSIPVHPLLTEDNLNYICDTINAIDKT
jgi:perosamine synthetase